MDKKPSPYGFVRAVFARWFTAMSGPLSVPAALAAYFVPNDTAKLLLALTAIACFVFTAYWIWAAERRKVVDLERLLEQAKSAPELRLDFSESLLGCMEITGTAPKRCLTVRVLPTTSDRVENCIGQLLRISESVDGVNWTPTNYIDALDLRWTHQKGDVERKSRMIANGAQQTLDVLTIGEREYVMSVSTFTHPRTLPDFESGKWFRFDVKVFGDNGAEAEIALKLKRGKAWNDLTIEKL